MTDQIKANLSAKSTPELQALLKLRDNAEWSEDAFAAMAEILHDRNETIPTLDKRLQSTPAQASDSLAPNEHAKVAAIVFIILNSLGALLGLFILFVALQMQSRLLGSASSEAVLQKFIFLLVGTISFFGSCYAVFTASMLLAGQMPKLWKSGAIVSMVAGTALMCLPLFHVPVAIWLLKMIKSSGDIPSSKQIAKQSETPNPATRSESDTIE